MNFRLTISVFLFICFTEQSTVNGQATGISQVDDITSAINNQLNALLRQITSVQSVMVELSRSVASIPTRITQGLDGENATDNRDNSAWSGMTSNFVDQAMTNPFVVIFSNQVNQLQRALTDISMSVQRMIDSGSRIITGAPKANSPEVLADESTSEVSEVTQATTLAATTTTTEMPVAVASDNNSPATDIQDTRASSGVNMFTRAIEMARQQMSHTQKILAEMRESMSSIVATGSRVIAGDLGPTPIGTTLDIMQSVTREVHNMQSTMKRMNEEFNRALANGTRSIVGSGQLPKYYANEDTQMLTGMLTTTVNELTEQLDRIQSALNTLSNEVRIIATRTVNRISPSRGSLHHSKSKHHKLVKRADALVVNGLQRAAGEITQNLGALGGTLARIAGGMTGIRIPGSGVGLPNDSNRNSQIDESQRAFSGLNPIGVIGRGVGNIANSLSRIVPTSTGK